MWSHVPLAHDFYHISKVGDIRETMRKTMINADKTSCTWTKWKKCISHLVTIDLWPNSSAECGGSVLCVYIIHPAKLSVTPLSTSFVFFALFIMQRSAVWRPRQNRSRSQTLARFCSTKPHRQCKTVQACAQVCLVWNWDSRFAVNYSRAIWIVAIS